MHDNTLMSESATVAVLPHDDVKWRCEWAIEKYATPDVELLRVATADELAALTSEEQLRLLTDLGLEPFERLEREGNLLMYGGASILWEALIGAAPTAFSNANATIGVGDSTTAAAATQTDLAGTNKLRKAMDATYPTHTDGTASGNASVVFRSTFGSSDANFAWQEWGVFNASSSGRMLNRKVESLGTKASGSSWQFSVTLSLA